MNEPVVQNHLHYYEAPPQPPQAPNGSILVYDTRPRRNPLGWYLFLFGCLCPPIFLVFLAYIGFKMLRGVIGALPANSNSKLNPLSCIALVVIALGVSSVVLNLLDLIFTGHSHF